MTGQWSQTGGSAGWRAIGAVVATLLLAGCEMKGMIFFPERVITLTPKEAGLAYEDVYLTTNDSVQLNGWFLPSPGAETTLLWLHGNGGNIGDRVEHLRFLHRRLRVHQFIIDYRGYGRSAGSISEEGTYLDAAAALAYLRGRPEGAAQKIVYYGQSLGAAVAVELARHAPPAGLILEAPFTSIRDMARVVVPLLPFTGFVSTKYDSMAKIGEIRAPVLILHGDRDDVIPFEQGRRLYEAANEPKTFYTIPGAEHNDTYIVGGEPYAAALRSFLASLR